MPISIDAGSLRCHVLLDGVRPVSPRFVFKDYDDDVHGPFVRPYLDDQGMLAGRMTALVVESDAGTLLVDAGMGLLGREIGAGRVLEELAALGIRPWDVRTVVITHGHADHVGGLLGPDRDPVFADARHVIHRAEATFWASDAAAALPRDAGAPAAAALDALLGAELLDQVDGPTTPVPGVRAIEAPGHTPGHLALVVDDALVWAGDAFVGMLNVSHPDWVSAADMDGPRNEATRRELLGVAADGGLALAAAHMPDVVRVRRAGDAFALDEG